MIEEIAGSNMLRRCKPICGGMYDAKVANTMSEKLREAIQRILNRDGMASATKMAGRQGAVLPALDALGRNTWDVEEVIPEYVVN